MDNKIEKEIKTVSDLFYGGVIYIDLRGYTNIVQEKTLENIAEIIYSYQKEVKSTIESFLRNEIRAIEFVGDGVMCIIKQGNYDKHIFSNKLFEVANKLRDKIKLLIANMKERYSELNNLDFGIGISTSNILKNTIFENNSEQRDIYFGNSLNRACKIGDRMNSKKNHIGMDKRMYDENNAMYNDFVENDYYYIMFNKFFTKEEKPIVHLILMDS